MWAYENSSPPCSKSAEKRLEAHYLRGSGVQTHYARGRGIQAHYIRGRSVQAHYWLTTSGVGIYKLIASEVWVYKVITSGVGVYRLTTPGVGVYKLIMWGWGVHKLHHPIPTYLWISFAHTASDPSLHCTRVIEKDINCLAANTKICLVQQWQLVQEKYRQEVATNAW